MPERCSSAKGLVGRLFQRGLFPNAIPGQSLEVGAPRFRCNATGARLPGRAGGCGTPDYPLTDIPFQVMIDRAGAGAYQARPARTFRFEEIQEAHRLMESSQANGKIVVRV